MRRRVSLALLHRARARARSRALIPLIAAGEKETRTTTRTNTIEEWADPPQPRIWPLPSTRYL
jgi:hypothetical protein